MTPCALQPLSTLRENMIVRQLDATICPSRLRCDSKDSLRRPISETIVFIVVTVRRFHTGSTRSSHPRPLERVVCCWPIAGRRLTSETFRKAAVESNDLRKPFADRDRRSQGRGTELSYEAAFLCALAYRIGPIRYRLQGYAQTQSRRTMAARGINGM
jgi:hypothetical protein